MFTNSTEDDKSVYSTCHNWFLTQIPPAIAGFVTDEFNSTDLVCGADTLKIWVFFLRTLQKDELCALKYRNCRCKIVIASELPTW